MLEKVEINLNSLIYIGNQLKNKNVESLWFILLSKFDLYRHQDQFNFSEDGF